MAKRCARLSDKAGKKLTILSIPSEITSDPSAYWPFRARSCAPRFLRSSAIITILPIDGRKTFEGESGSSRQTNTRFTSCSTVFRVPAAGAVSSDPAAPAGRGQEVVGLLTTTLEEEKQTRPQADQGR
jgi:hypothetical protein